MMEKCKHCAKVNEKEDERRQAVRKSGEREYKSERGCAGGESVGECECEGENQGIHDCKCEGGNQSGNECKCESKHEHEHGQEHEHGHEHEREHGHEHEHEREHGHEHEHEQEHEHGHEHGHECGCKHSDARDCCGHGGGGCCGERASGRKTILRVIICLPLLVLSYIGLDRIFARDVLVYFDPAIIVILWLGTAIFRSAFDNIKKRKITSSLLISIAVWACVILQVITYFVETGDGHSHSYLFAAGEIVFLMCIGQLIEDFTVRRSQSGISKLIALIPQTARRVCADGQEQVVDIKQIAVGDIVSIYANENITVDGVVVEGTCFVNQANLTGESVPVEKSVGDKVFASTYNTNGVIKVCVEKALNETSISKIVEMVREANGKQAAISRLADRIASFIIPAAVGASFVVFGVAIALFNTSVVEAIIRMVTVLVVFCPCALAIATPTAVAATIGRNSSDGVLVKNGSALEILSKTDVIAFDKTGTLTEGVLTVSDSKSLRDDVDWFGYAVALEKFSNHPVGVAIAACGGKPYEVADVESKVGFGISGKVDGHLVTVGKSEGADVNVFVDDALCGTIALRDKVRADMREVIGSLGKRHDIVMLSGDNHKTAEEIAQLVGITDFRAGLLPIDKSEQIRAMQEAGSKVAMVGDGVNDSVSLTQADCGIAVAGLGSDLALECADIVLLNGNVGKLPSLVSSSRSMMRTIIANICISLCISFVSIVVSAFGIINPAIGAVIHNLSSVLVAANSARLLVRRREKAGAQASV